MPEEAEVPLEKVQDDIKDKLEEVRHEIERAPWPGFLTRASFVQLLALTTAIFAVLAAIASLASGDYANEALFKANEATLSQDQATDAWAEYQADGIKRIQYANAAGLLQAQNAAQPTVQAALDNAKAEGDKQPSVQSRAQTLEQDAADLQRDSKEQLDHHHRFAYSVTLFQVAIGLAALAALVNLQPLWWASLAAGVAGTVLFIYGFAPVSEPGTKVEAPAGSATPGAMRLVTPPWSEQGRAGLRGAGQPPGGLSPGTTAAWPRIPEVV